MGDIQKDLVPASTGSLFFDVARFEHAQRVANALASSTMVPDHFHKNIGNVLIALNLAERYGADPWMVMQNIYIVHGKPGIEAKLVIARINSTGRFEPLRWRHEHEKTYQWRCICYAKEKRTGHVLEADCDWDTVVAEGWDKEKKGYPSKWVTMPKLMFQYRSAAFWSRLYCPEATLGMMTREEVIDMAEQRDRSYSVREKTLGKLEDLKTRISGDGEDDPDEPDEDGPSAVYPTSWDDYVDAFIMLRSSWERWVHEHADELAAAPEWVQEKARNKWSRMSATTEKPWPLAGQEELRLDDKKNTADDTPEAPEPETEDPGELLPYDPTEYSSMYSWINKQDPDLLSDALQDLQLANLPGAGGHAMRNLCEHMLEMVNGQ